MPHYILHVGPHKTGTSHIQNWLRQNADMLERAGMHLASQWSDTPLNPSHTGLVQRLNTERRCELQPVFDGWRRSRYKAVIVSCEDLATMSREPVKVQMLRELTAGSPVSIVYYVRRWSELLASEWQEYVKQGSTFTLPEILVHNLRNPNASRSINVDVCLDVFSAMFGRQAIKLVSYDGVLASGQDLVDHFSDSFLGGLALKLPNQRLVNAALSAPRTELMRLFNCLEQETGVDSRRLLRFLQSEHSPSPMIRLLDHLDRFVSTIDLDDEDPAVKDVLIGSRQTYRAAALPPVDATRFYPPKTVQLRFIRPEYALTSGFADAVRRLWHDLLAMERPRSAP